MGYLLSFMVWQPGDTPSLSLTQDMIHHLPAILFDFFSDGVILSKLNTRLMSVRFFSHPSPGGKEVIGQNIIDGVPFCPAIEARCLQRAGPARGKFPDVPVCLTIRDKS